MKIFGILKTRAILALVAIFGVVATSLPAVAGDLIADIQKRGTLKVGMSTFVPWAMRDKKGDLIGFEIDVATKLTKLSVRRSTSFAMVIFTVTKTLDQTLRGEAASVFLSRAH